MTTLAGRWPFPPNAAAAGFGLTIAALVLALAPAARADPVPSPDPSTQIQPDPAPSSAAPPQSAEPAASAPAPAHAPPPAPSPVATGAAPPVATAHANVKKRHPRRQAAHHAHATVPHSVAALFKDMSEPALPVSGTAAARTAEGGLLPLAPIALLLLVFVGASLVRLTAEVGWGRAG